MVRKPHLLWRNYFNSRYFPLNVIRYPGAGVTCRRRKKWDRKRMQNSRTSPQHPADGPGLLLAEGALRQVRVHGAALPRHRQAQQGVQVGRGHTFNHFYCGAEYRILGCQPTLGQNKLCPACFPRNRRLAKYQGLGIFPILVEYYWSIYWNISHALSPNT